MIQTSQAYREAIVGSPRGIELFAVVDISDPDKKYLPTTGSPEAPWSKKEELHNYDLSSPPRYMTGERGRTLLNGTFDLFPDDYSVQNEVGYAGKVLSGSSGAFEARNIPLGEWALRASAPARGDQSPLEDPPALRGGRGMSAAAGTGDPPWVQINISGVRVLQACSFFFSGDPVDGVPCDYTVEVIQGHTAYFTREVTGNYQTEAYFKGFTVYDPDAVRLTVKRWSIPSRRVRLVEVVTGLFERWTGDDLDSFNATLQGQFSCLSLPYGSVNLAMDNADRRFEPRKKDSIFQSIEERQGVELYIGCQTAAGMERVKLGVFYQSGDGWKTSSNELTMQWYLVDIIGLVSGRTFIVPAVLPATLGGWLKAVVSQLGEAFVNMWHADPEYENRPVIANSAADVTGKKCGDIIRWACQASGTWPRARQEDGALTAEPLWNQGNRYDLDNLVSYPTMKANESLAALIFQLADGNQTQYVVSGNSTTSEKTVTIINPFIHDAGQALTAARLILAQYGGNLLEFTGRGDPSSEIGDVDTVWLDESSATTARRMSQTFQFQGGVMRSCRSTLLQADGSYLWTEFAVIRESGTWKAPPGVRQLRIVLGRGGQGSGPGGDGWIGRGGFLGTGLSAGYGDNGVDGVGGEIWYGVIDINEEQEFEVVLGAGGAPGVAAGQAGSFGGHTAFGAYSSEDGQLYPNGYTDIANGQAFARTGVPAPLPGSGDGAKGGKGGDPGEGYIRTYTYTPNGADPSVVNTGYELVVTKKPGKGAPGKAGATGFVMVTWEKPEASSV